MLVDLGLEAFRQLPRAGVVTAGIRRDREARRDGDPETGHLGETGALAAQEFLGSLGRLVEVEDVAPAHSAKDLPMGRGDYASSVLLSERWERRAADWRADP